MRRCCKVPGDDGTVLSDQNLKVGKAPSRRLKRFQMIWSRILRRRTKHPSFIFSIPIWGCLDDGLDTGYLAGVNTASTTMRGVERARSRLGIEVCEMDLGWVPKR